MLRSVLLAAAGCLVAPTIATAHFILMTPDSWMSQDALGLPEKLGPCGNEGGGTPTDKITTFQAGQTITVTIDEVIAHPGHYRVALANDQSEIPPEPVVTPSALDPCASVAIQNPPIFPILADNLLVHTQPFDAPQTFTVTLPTDMTCTKCTLQVLEFMSSHGQPCFYHHCADISIQGAPDTPTASPIPTESPTQTVIPPATPSPTPVAVCAGDCNGDGQVTVEELLTMVNIALGNADVSECTPEGTRRDSGVTVDEILAAVNNALNGCG